MSAAGRITSAATQALTKLHVQIEHNSCWANVLFPRPMARPDLPPIPSNKAPRDMTERPAEAGASVLLHPTTHVVPRVPMNIWTTAKRQ